MAQIQDDDGALTTSQPVTTPVQTTYHLALDTLAPPSAAPDQEILYQLEYHITGNEILPQVTLTDTLPPSTTYVSGSCSGGCQSAGKRLIWELGEVVPNVSGTLQFSARLEAPLPHGTPLLNQAALLDHAGQAARSMALTTVDSAHAFEIQISDQGSDPIPAGKTIHYTITWSLSGDERARDIQVRDELPQGSRFAGCAPACLAARKVVTWTLGDDAPPVSKSLYLSINIDSPLLVSTSLTNQVSIWDGNGGRAAQASERTTVLCEHTLHLHKHGPPDPVRPGQEITYTLAYSVSGDAPAEDVTLQDTLSPHTDRKSVV